MEIIIGRDYSKQKKLIERMEREIEEDGGPDEEDYAFAEKAAWDDFCSNHS